MIYPSVKHRRRILLVVLGLYLVFILLSIAAYNFYKTNDETFANLIDTDKREIGITNILPTNSVLGIFNSVTLTPTPIESDIIAQEKINKPNPSATTKSVISQTPKSINKNELYSLINKYRESKGLPLIQIDPRLEISSYAKAKDMVARNYFDHGNPWSFITATGYKFNYAAENLAINYYSSASIVKGWQDSPSHNKTMLDTRNQHMGFTYLCDVDIANYNDTCLAVIHFGREAN